MAHVLKQAGSSQGSAAGASTVGETAIALIADARADDDAAARRSSKQFDTWSPESRPSDLPASITT